MRHPDGLYYYQLENHQVSSQIPIIKHSGKEILPTEPEFADRWAAEPLRQLRQQRNQLLAQSDWMALSDRTMTQAQIDYRQALRDLPETSDPQLDEQGNLTNVTWPERPE
jgi:hypothetical protein